MLSAGDEKMIDIRRLQRARGFWVVVAAWAVTASVGVVVLSRVTEFGPASAGTAAQRGQAPGLSWDVSLYPLGPPGSPVAERTTVAGAAAIAGFPVLVPTGAGISRANLSQVWVNTHGPGREVALVFDRGKVDILMHRATYQSDLSYFRAFVAQKEKNRATAALGHVNGRRALIITPSTDALTHSNPAVVEFNRKGVDVAIYSHSYGTHTMLAIADSMK